MFIKKPTEIPNGICNQGFTLLEILIAMAIFAIGILAVGSMQISAINTNASSRNSTTVVTMAKDRVEELMALPYPTPSFVVPDLVAGEHSVAAGSFTQATDGIDNDEDGQIDEAGETGQVSITWNVTDDVPRVGTKSIRVTVVRTVGTAQKRASLDFIKVDM